MFEQLHNGALYYPNADEIMEVQTQCMEKLYDYNRTRPGEQARRAALLKEMFAEIGEGCYIEPPLHANWGGRFVRFGKNVYANFGLTLVDDTRITDPILPKLREKGLQYNMPVHIGKNCWIGAGALIMPGVTIGDNAVIGAGSVVTKDIPSNVVAVGNPCRLLRPVGDKDRKYYFRGRKIPKEFFED